MKQAILLTGDPGTGFNGHDVPAPLVKVGGRSLITRALVALERQGVHQVMVVVGYRGEEIRRSVSHDPEVTSGVVWIEASDDEVQDGRALLKARPYLHGPTVVLESQVMFDPGVLGLLDDAWHRGPGGLLLVDRNLSRVFDLAGAVKVHTGAGQVLDMGPELPRYDAVSTGLGVISPETLDLFDPAPGDALSVAGLARHVARVQGLRTVDVGDHQWQEIASPETRMHGEWMVRAYGADLAGGKPAPQPESLSPHDPRRTLSYIEGLLSEKNARHYVLFNPGPVLTSARVKSALVHHDVCHRDSDYSHVLRRLQHKLRRVCGGGPEHDIVLLSGSGTAAMEAAISSCIPSDRKLLVVSNGAFGERFNEIAQVHNLQTVHLRREWGELIAPEEVAAALDADPGIVATVMCHHETSVGILNPVREVGALCRARDRLFFVDAVSSLAGEELSVRQDNIDVLISSANKCLHAISGVSFACVHSRIWPRVAEIDPRVYYLDLRRYHRYSESLSQTPFTPAVSNFFALDAALDELLQQGVESRIRHYQTINTRIRKSLARMGLTRFTTTGHESHSITTVRTPSYVSFDQIYEEMKERGYVVYGCKEHLKDRYFQIANMGELSEEMVDGFLDTLRHVLERAALRHAASRGPTTDRQPATTGRQPEALVH